MVAQTRHGANPQSAQEHRRLAFKDKLISKGQSTDALLKKLRTVHEQLAQLDQEIVELKSLDNVQKELLNTSIMLHRDRGVKAYAACCLADILRLCAPKAPYTPPQLRDIFEFFAQQLLKGLEGTDAAYYGQYYFLLESLSTVKSVVLVCDLQDDELFSKFFTAFFTIVRRSLAKKVELFMADILIALIDESHSVPEKVLETLQAQFMDESSRTDQPAYQLAVQVCTATADKLQGQISQDFSEKLVESAREENFDEVRQLHELIKRLNRAVPSLLRSVVPQIEEELRAEDTNVRTIATQTLGEMFCDNGGSDLIKKYPTTWAAWLQRKNDKTAGIRLRFVEACKGLLASFLPEPRAAVEEALSLKLMDPDEKVRAAVCRLYSQLDYETVLHHVSEEQLKRVAERGADKKQNVRYEALNALGKLYSLAYSEIENHDPHAIRQYGWIPNEILQMSSNTPEVKTTVEQVMADYILPLPSSNKNVEVDEVAWTDRLLNVVKYLGEQAFKGLLALSQLRTSSSNPYQVFLEACIENNGGIIDKDEPRIKARLRAVIQHLSTTFLDPAKASEDLHAFAKLNENRLYSLLKKCADPQVDLKTLVKNTAEFERRIEQSSSSISQTMFTVLRRVSLRTINQSSVPILIKRMQHGAPANNSQLRPSITHTSSMMSVDSTPLSAFTPTSQTPQTQTPVHSHHHHPFAFGAGLTRNDSSSIRELQKEAVQMDATVPQRAQVLLVYAAKYCPGLFKPHVGELVKVIAAVDEDEDEADGGMDEGKERLVELAVQALAALVTWDKGLWPKDKKTKERVLRLATHTNARHAKFATKMVAASPDSGLAQTLAEAIVEHLPEVDEDTILARVTALAQLARYSPEAFETKSEEIMTFLLKQVLMVGVHRTPENMDEDNVEEWAADEDLTPIMAAKVQALKVVRNRCLAQKTVEVAKPVILMLTSLLENNGSMVKGVDEEPTLLSRMRLQAAISLLHLSTQEEAAKMISPSFARLAVTIQDSCYNVRIAFLFKLLSLLQPRKLPPRFNVIPFLTVHDPEADVKSTAAFYVTNAFKKMPEAIRIEHLEMIFVRLLHLLAHHPDFSRSHEELVDIAKYIQFYLNLIATSETVSLLYHLAQKGKMVRDAESHTYTENFYILCELAQELIKVRAQNHSWALLNYPGKVRLPSDILRPLPNAEAANKVVKTVYLPEETQKWVAELGKPSQNKERKERKATGKRKAPATKTNGATKKRAAKRRRDDDDDDDDDDSESSSEANEESDVEMAEVGGEPQPPTSDAPDEEEGDEDEEGNGKGGRGRLGRAARTLAKARIKKQTRGGGSGATSTTTGAKKHASSNGAAVPKAQQQKAKEAESRESSLSEIDDDEDDE